MISGLDPSPGYPPRDKTEIEIANEAMNKGFSEMLDIRRKNAAVGLLRALNEFQEKPDLKTVAKAIQAADHAQTTGALWQSSSQIKTALAEAQKALKDLQLYTDLNAAVEAHCKVIAQQGITCLQLTGLLPD